MVRWFAMWAASAVILNVAPTAARAVAAEAACKDTGVVTASPMQFDAGDKAVVDGLAVSLKLGLSPASFPANDIAAIARPCRRGEVKVGADTYQLFGSNADTPPRWAQGPQGGRTAFLALIPDPIEAGQWAAHHAGDKGDKGEAKFKTSFYALAIAEGDRRLVYAILRHIPDDYHLALDMAAAIGRTESPIAVLDLDSGAVDLRRLSMAGVTVPQPGAPLTGKAEIADAFAREGADGLRHGASGLHCPHELAGYERREVRVLNPADHGRDVMCKFYSEKSWFSVFATRMDNSSLDAMLDLYMKEALVQTPQDRALEPPPGPALNMETKSRFWVGKEGAQQGMWVARRGPWYYQLRVTYQPGTEGQVAAFAKQMFDLIAREPSPGTV